ncbi:60S acidic ribosomal protein P0 [Capsicum baccatum]|uniref:60S acidic ribosomal protein P0 n=1 Tax=Capsicum baccatum TaxID=33114 RepID=A0A2G2XCJ0_CAPBA|nr:60S acidic ribosomal protein P0 [Capsicum baccatum]
MLKKTKNETILNLIPLFVGNAGLIFTKGDLKELSEEVAKYNVVDLLVLAIVVENKYSFPPADKVKEYVADPSMFAAVAAALVATASSSVGSTTKGTIHEKNVQVSETCQVKARRKRKCSFEVQDVVGDIRIKFKEVATSIDKMINSRIDVTKDEVMAMKGYKEEFIGDAFDYFVQSNTLA